MPEITLKAFQSERCSHKWLPKESNKLKVFTKCKSPYWDTPRRIVGKSQKEIDFKEKRRLR